MFVVLCTVIFTVAAVICITMIHFRFTQIQPEGSDITLLHLRIVLVEEHARAAITIDLAAGNQWTVLAVEPKVSPLLVTPVDHATNTPPVILGSFAQNGGTTSSAVTNQIVLGSHYTVSIGTFANVRLRDDHCGSSLLCHLVNLISWVGKRILIPMQRTHRRGLSSANRIILVEITTEPVDVESHAVDRKAFESVRRLREIVQIGEGVVERAIAKDTLPHAQHALGWYQWMANDLHVGGAQGGQIRTRDHVEAHRVAPHLTVEWLTIEIPLFAVDIVHKDSIVLGTVDKVHHREGCHLTHSLPLVLLEECKHSVAIGVTGDQTPLQTGPTSVGHSIGLLEVRASAVNVNVRKLVRELYRFHGLLKVQIREGGQQKVW
mmetsp:Transcript_14368/g.43206  ORF Transcript_14368/g.43206 Transcript_14368/m.43206 type:complete len:377 (+) Transcript_14368:1402-2532(+)